MARIRERSGATRERRPGTGDEHQPRRRDYLPTGTARKSGWFTTVKRSSSTRTT
jgi:hypothetical protein